jgi:hypothetical protein
MVDGDLKRELWVVQGPDGLVEVAVGRRLHTHVMEVTGAHWKQGW